MPIYKKVKTQTHKDSSVKFYKLFKKINKLLDQEQSGSSTTEELSNVLRGIITSLKNDLGLYSARIYKKDEGGFILIDSIGDETPTTQGLCIIKNYKPVKECLKRGIFYAREDDPEIDRNVEQTLRSPNFACVEVGDGEYILAFSTHKGFNPDNIIFSLSIIRHLINQKITKKKFESLLEEAKNIQNSILPDEQPLFGDFDIAGKTVPAETIGGDYFDFIPITDKILGLAIADASGHGLSAALQVRDIYMGLRMGMSRDFKIVRTVERINYIVHQASLTNRFVALFYGELELSGNFIYVNAGHIPPVLITKDNEIHHLSVGGPVIGPISHASYERDFHKLRSGDMIIMFTDGIIETRNDENQEFSLERLLEIVISNKYLSANQIVETVFKENDDFSSNPPDDRTLVVIKHI